MKRFAKNISIYIALFLVVLTVAFFYKGMDKDKAEIKEVPLSKFVQYLEDEKIKEINVTDTKLTGKLSDKEIVYAYANSVVEISMIDEIYLFPQMQEGTLKYESDPPDTGSVFLSLLPTIIMVVALGFLFYIMMNQGGNGKAFQFAKSRAKMVKGGEKWLTSLRTRENIRSWEQEYRREFCWSALREQEKLMFPRLRQEKPACRFSL